MKNYEDDEVRRIIRINTKKKKKKNNKEQEGFEKEN